MKSTVFFRQLTAIALGLGLSFVVSSQSLLASPAKQTPASAAQSIAVTNETETAVCLDELPTFRFHDGPKSDEQLALAPRIRSEDDETPNAANTAKVAPGTPDEAVLNFCKAVADDNTATASDYVSSTARGMAEQLREGTLPEERIADFVKFLNPFGELKPVPEPPNGNRRTLRNGKGQTMTFTLRKEKEVYKITEVILKTKK